MNPESIKQAPEKISLVEQQKLEASRFVSSRIEELMNQKNLGTLEASKVVYEEVKGHDYRKEQTIAKLVEYLEIQNELSMRGGELERIGLGAFLGKESANDARYTVAA